jgi:surface polysaccharide O-acyltransferase-like enzyme
MRRINYHGPPSIAAAPASDEHLVAARSKRIATIDAGRFIAVLAVILIHTASSTHFAALADAPAEVSPLGALTDQLCRFAVPYFFVTSGFFLARSQTSLSSAWRIVRRIAPIYIFWTLTFLACHPEAYKYLGLPSFYARLLFTGGIAPHLWFLTSLMLNMGLVVFFDRWIKPNLLLAAAIILYLIGLALSAYHLQVFGTEASTTMNRIARDAPFFGFIFVLVGFRIRQNGWIPPVSLSLAILVLGVAAELAEFYGLVAVTGIAHDRDYLLSTLPFGIGAFLTALSFSRVAGPSKFLSYLAYLGTFSLGIYALHPLIVEALGQVMSHETFTDRLALAGVTALASTLAIIGLARLRAFKMLVT